MEFVIYEKKNTAAVIKVNRPKALNALSMGVLEDLEEAVSMAEKDPEVRVLVITGEGKAFVAGADIALMSDMNMMDSIVYEEKGQKLFRRIELMHKPVIAAINGYALGGGCELALACDIRIASAKAIMGLPETGLGIIPGYGGTQRLPRLVGTGKAKELIYTARKINAEEACAIGLVNCVVEPEELMPAAMKMAEEITKNGPIAVAFAKDAINRGVQTDLDSGLEIEIKNNIALFSTEDLHEGMKAFLEKRNPEFKGR